MLERIRIVMVETTHPGNIGAAARAMKTMGLSDLRLVSPKAFPNAEATARASGAASAMPTPAAAASASAPRCSVATFTALTARRCPPRFRRQTGLAHS